MKTNVMSPAVVAVIGIVLSLMAIAGITFGLIKPVQDKTVVAQARYDAAHPDSLPGAQMAAQKLLDADTLKAHQTLQTWRQVDAALMPRFDVSNRFGALRQLTYELTQKLGPDLEHHARLAARSGVSSTSNFALPAPPVNPNDITNAPVVIPLGTLTDVGHFRGILTNVYNWQYFNRLVLIDDLALHGNSPFMQGTYTATIFLFPQNDTHLPAPIPAAGGGAAATTTGGRPGSPFGAPGGPGSFPSRSPGGPGSYPGR